MDLLTLEEEDGREGVKAMKEESKQKGGSGGSTKDEASSSLHLDANIGPEARQAERGHDPSIKTDGQSAEPHQSVPA